MSLRTFLLISAPIACAISHAVYAFWGFLPENCLLWIGILVVWTLGQRGGGGGFERHEVIDMTCLALVFSPLYLVGVYEFPFPMSTDELVITDVMRRLTESSALDPLGLSYYFQFPSLPFVVLGRAAGAMGGVDFERVRFLHALCGLAIVPVSYLFFREVLPPGRFDALVASALLGCNHALVVISRMAMRDNIALLCLALSFALAFRGVRRESDRSLFLGGIVAGIGFYQYFPARMTALLWGLFWLWVFLFVPAERREARRSLVLFASGSIAAALPVLLATLKSPGLGLRPYVAVSFLVNREALELQRAWSNASTLFEGWLTNCVQGLLSFNLPIWDFGYIYSQHIAGCLDPLSGVLLWIGLCSMFRRNSNSLPGRFVPFSFLFCYLFFAFLLSKNPSYTRQFLFLPFVSALTVAGVNAIGDVIGIPPGRGKKLVLSIVLVLVATQNARTMIRFQSEALRRGDVMGATVRLIHRRTTSPVPYTYFFAGDDASRDLSFGGERRIDDWLAIARHASLENAAVRQVRPEQASSLFPAPPFVVFLGPAHAETIGVLKDRFPNASVMQLDPESRNIAVEVPAG